MIIWKIHTRHLNFILHIFGRNHSGNFDKKLYAARARMMDDHIQQTLESRMVTSENYLESKHALTHKRVPAYEIFSLADLQIPSNTKLGVRYYTARRGVYIMTKQYEGAKLYH